MHRTTSLKFTEAKQAKEIYHYKNTKRKLYRTNAAIWYNKTCRLKQLTPTYINISINGKNQATLEGSSCTDIMTCTGGCGYSF